MLVPIKKELTIYQGSTFRKKWSLTNKETGEPIDLSGYTGRMQIREKLKDEDFIIELTTENGMISIEQTAEETQLSLYISPEDTAAMSILKGVFDLELVDTMGDVYRLLQGTVVISREVTR